MPKLRDIGQSQQFDWGSIRWLLEPGRNGAERISAGFFTFDAGATQEEHVHVGYEQVMYVVAGGGWHEVNGEPAPLGPGTLMHIPAFARHVMHNDTAEPLTLISVYFPVRSQNRMSPREEYASREKPPAEPVWSALDLESLADLLHKLSGALGFRLSLFDDSGKRLIDTGNAPEFCQILDRASHGRHCRGKILAAIHEHTRATDPSAEPGGKLFFCCHSVVSMLIPIRSGQKIIGYIKCGEVFLSKSDRNVMTGELQYAAEQYRLSPRELLEAARNIRLEMQSVLYGAAETAQAVTSYIAAIAANAYPQRESQKDDFPHPDHDAAANGHEAPVHQDEEYTFLQSRLGPHFLCNTLSTAANMAYMESAANTANVIWSLAGLLRFSLKQAGRLISITEEIQFLRDYIAIQQARFGDRLSVTWDIDPDIGNVRIPGLLLQPLVENAILHGLEPMLEPGHIIIRIKNQGGTVLASITDNGAGFEPPAGSAAPDGIGIASIRSRLQYYFADAFTFTITSEPGKGTAATIRLPSGGMEGP